MGIAERIAITTMVTAKNFAMMLRPPVFYVRPYRHLRNAATEMRLVSAAGAFVADGAPGVSARPG
jgi:hypothetical protein